MARLSSYKWVYYTGNTKKRQARTPVWVMPNGNATTVGANAAQFVLKNGRLSTVNGGYYSTADSVTSQPFALSSTLQFISTTFIVQQGTLNWTNAAFSDGVAQLFQVSASLVDNAQVIARFSGPIDPSWAAVSLGARPTNEATQGSSGGTGSGSISTTMNVGGMSSGPQASSPGMPGVGYPSASGSGSLGSRSSVSASMGQPGGPSVSASQPGGLSTGSKVSPNGLCGGPDGYTCTNSGFGDCCSQYGYCGTGETYCGGRCQFAFGICPAVSASATAMEPTSPNPSMSNPVGSSPESTPGGGPGPVTTVNNPMTSMSMAMSVVPGSTISNIPTPAPTFVCPDDDGQTVTDLDGTQYNLGCGQDTTIVAYGSAPVSDSFDECFGLCDAEPHCTAFTYSGGVNGVGFGTCYFKNGEAALVNQDATLVGAIRISPSPGESSSGSPNPTSTFTSPAGPIGPINPGGPTGSMAMSMNISGPYAPPSTPATMPGTIDMSSMISAPTTTPTSMSISMSGPDTASAATPTGTGPMSPNGHCGTQGNGGTPDGYSCFGSAFGICCSSSGFCGNSTDYCLAACQSDYGDCTPQGIQPITVTGECGVDWGNQTCTGGVFGACCSTNGYCGNTTDYCDGQNCDPMFGVCNGPNSSSTMMLSTSRPISLTSTMTPLESVFTTSSEMSDSMSSSSPAGMVPSTSSSSQNVVVTTTTTSSTSISSSSMMSSASPSTGPSHYNPPCPAANGTGYYDTADNEYVILCDLTTDPGAFASSVEVNFESCINACAAQTSQACVAVTYLAGTCYFKAQYYGDISSPGTEAAVLESVLGVTPATYTPGGSTPMTTSSSSSTAAISRSPTSTSISSSITAATSRSRSTSSSVTSSASVTGMFSSSTLISSTTTTSGSSSSTNYLVLTSPTPCTFGDPPGYDEDDSYCEITLPFQMQMYGQTDVNTYPSTNGYLSLHQGSSQYSSQQLPASNIPNNTVAPFFDDLYLTGNSNPQQGIFYQFNSAQTAVTYEYYLTRAGEAQFYHFTVAYDSTNPGVFTYTYYSTGGPSDEGLYASVGTQGVDASGTEQGFTYSFQSPDIAPGLMVVCDTQANTCTTSSGGSKVR